MIVSKDAQSVIKSALPGARAAVRKAEGKRNIKKPRILFTPTKTGGILLFLIPLFASFSATGALACEASGVAKAINDMSAAKKQLEETKRHNQTMESITIGKSLYLKLYR